MNRFAIAVAWAGLSFAAAASSAPVIQVEFVDPGRYSDSEPRNLLVDERAPALGELRIYLQELGTKLLADGDRLRVEVLDVDLAGEFEPSAAWRRHVRVLRHAALPRIYLRYTLERGGRVALTGEERLVDPAYLHESRACAAGTPLCHEKRLLRGWLVRLASS